MALQIKVYESNNRNTSFFHLIAEMFKDLFSSAELAKRLFLRDKKAEYRQSLFGVLWAIITPFMNAMVWIFLSASGAVKITGSDGIPYPLFVFLGTMLWSIFSESVSAPLAQTTASKALISKINFPKEAILLSGIYKMFFNSGIKIMIMLAVVVFFKINPGIGVFNFILVLLLLILFGYSLGLIITPVGMLYTDIGRAIPLVLPMLMYLTPVVYKTTRIPSLQSIINANPLTPLINSCRNLLTGESFESPLYLGIIFLVTLILMFIGWIFYRVSIPIIVERM